MTGGVIEWADLTSTQRTTLLGARRLIVDTQAFLLNFDLSVAADLTAAVDNKSGDIAWDSTATVHRDCQLTLRLGAELAWGIDMVQLYKIYTDPVSGLSARRPRGVFAMTEPDKQLGTKILDTGSRLYDKIAYPVTGQDRLYWLNRPISFSYYIAALDGSGNPVKVLDALRQVFIDSGVTDSTLWGVLIDGTRSDATIPQDMVWPLLPDNTNSAGDDTSSAMTTLYPGDPDLANLDTSSGSSGYTWLQIINELLKLITYRACWVDNVGRYRCAPYTAPAVASPTWTFKPSQVSMKNRSLSRNRWSPPNRWIGIWQNMPPDVDGNTVTPTLANLGIQVLDNVDQGPSSQTAMQGLIFPVTVQYTAASASDMGNQLAARKASDLQVLTTYKYSSRQFPEAEHYDVFSVVDADIDGGSDKVMASNWQEPMDAGDTQWTWQSVAAATGS